MAQDKRPLAPHLQVYRWQLTSVLSITHRATGMLLTLGTILLAYWLLAIAAGPGAFASAQALLGSWVGQVVLFLWTLALYYHLCNGIRHLFWDAGYGFEIKTVYASGMAVVLATGVLTVVTWVMAMNGPGGGA
ncbi:MAG: succinate dehydrogenase, cytochrome b556 subunit [Gammaproteobacteria bacterium]|nr:succinate dehydrogenase, cytochrome b556 subunit [Gammaproteobacteria bacterium]MCI0590021.1 succinate dehydrogenase, cytochrome b556 subunit [Gammaproteobacteria bacterium]